MGARSVTVEIPKDPQHSKRLGDLAAKHKVYIGYHAHTQATDTAWDLALSQSPYNSMNLDCGHYIAAGGNNTKESLIALIQAKHDRITSMHIKDRHNKEKGGANVVWGLGETPLEAIFALLKEKKYLFVNDYNEVIKKLDKEILIFQTEVEKFHSENLSLFEQLIAQVKEVIEGLYPQSIVN